MRVFLDRLSMSFGSKKVFEDLSGDLSDDVYLVTGQNGSGKSTLLRILAGLLGQTSGKIIWDDNKKLDRLDLIGKIGFCSPDLSLYSELTVAENIKLFSKLSNVKTPNLKDWGLENSYKKMFSELSSGYKQRLKLLIAFIGSPPLLLLDEPEQHLDEIGLCLLTERIESRIGITVVATNNPWHDWRKFVSL